MSVKGPVFPGCVDGFSASQRPWGGLYTMLLSITLTRADVGGGVPILDSGEQRLHNKRNQPSTLTIKYSRRGETPELMPLTTRRANCVLQFEVRGAVVGGKDASSRVAVSLEELQEAGGTSLKYPCLCFSIFHLCGVILKDNLETHLVSVA